MKKIIVTLFIVFAFVQGAFASNWHQIRDKLYVDLDSCRTTSYRYETRFRFFTKELNPGDWELEKGKKVWFMLVEWETDGEKTKVRQIIYYDIKGNLIESLIEGYDFDDYLDFPVPDSKGETAIKIFKVLYHKGYFSN